MVKTDYFGELSANDFQIGDIVEWSSWDKEQENWISQYGILLNIENQMRSNRIISISKVMPLNEPHSEREFFTLSLKLVDKEKGKNL
tara:strand:- start:1673 stop:1933 length:261 start_codon:yes stop_codon:yes gene_type:complete